MSDIQELIHKTSMDCIEKGQRMERERILKMLEDSLKGCSGYDCERCDEVKGLSSAIALIKGEK